MSGEQFEFLWWQITFVSIAIGSSPVMIVSHHREEERDGAGEEVRGVKREADKESASWVR